jgi:hypothetical protein
MAGYRVDAGVDRGRMRSRLLGVRLLTALAALVLAGGLVVRMSAPLSSTSPSARQALSSNGVLELHADRDTPLFDQVSLLPGQPVAACTRLRTDALDDPAPIQLSMKGYQGSEALAAATQMTVEHGVVEDDAAGCGSFVVDAVVVSGSIADLQARHGMDGTPIDGGDPSAGQTDTWLRVTVELPQSAPSAVQGQAIGDLGLRWSTSMASPAERGFRDRATLVMAAVTEHSVIPLMLVVVLALRFLGIQDRFDRRDPKLALAPIVRGAVVFEPPPERPPLVGAGQGGNRTLRT